MLTGVKTVRHRAVLRAVLVAAAVFAALAAVPAYAWEVSKATNGLIVNRSADDTATGSITVTRYWGYKGGTAWVSAWNPSYSAAYTNSDTLTLDGLYLDGFEIDVKNGYRCQLIAISQAGAPSQVRFAILNDAARVTVENTPTVNVTGNTTVTVSGVPTVAVSHIPSISLDTTSLAVSATSTLPVDPWATANLPDNWQVGLVALGVVLVGVHGSVMLSRSVKRHA